MKNNKAKIIIPIIVVLLAAFFVIPFIFAEVDKNSIYTERNIAAPIFYGVMLFFSTAILVFYILRNKKKYLWAMLLFVSVAIVNTGYLALSLASNVSEALLANRIAYFGNIFMLLFLLITIINACKIAYRKSVVVLMLAASCIMFLLACTQGYLDIFYKNVDFAIVDGYAKIIKDYGPIHTAYLVYVLLYIIAMVGVLIYAIKNKKLKPAKYAIAIAGIGVLNIAIWFVEQFVDNKIEYLAFSYVVTEIIMIWICDRLIEDRVFDSIEIKLTIGQEDISGKTLNITVAEPDNNKLVISREKDTINLSNLSDENLLDIVNHINNSDKLTDREKEVAVLLIKNMKRKEVASSLFVSEDTVKTHTSHIFGKLKISSRKELQQLAQNYAKKDE